MSLRHFHVVVACAAALSLAACGSTSPPEKPGPPGPENCTNGKDDNGDRKTDCADPLCFKIADCLPQIEECANALDDDGDSLVDCADPDCEGKECGLACSCGSGAKHEALCNDDLDNDGDGKTDCPDSDCATAPHCLAAAGEAGKCNNGLDDDSDGLTDCADVVDCDAAACGTGCACGGGKKAEAACGDTQDNDGDTLADCLDSDCAGTPGCAVAPSEAGKCNDGFDNDNDGLTDCQDSADCTGAACGAGCTCAAGGKKETQCTDGADNDLDSKADCADPDCLGAGTESCTDGVDNTCDRLIDCADPKCTGNAACANLSDGKACSAGGQCAGGKCLTEAATGVPNGACSNLVSCSVSAQTGCKGGICVESGTFDVCREKCSGTGLLSPGKCRRGFACLDADLSTSNSNNHCEPLCDADADCSGSGTSYGCNPWSHLCQIKDRGLSKYGAACSSDTACETGRCSLGKPGGYCLGLCNGVSKACGGVGVCYYDASYGDNVGACLQGCGSTSQCRGYPYTCLQEDSEKVCWCRDMDEECSSDGNCCSGSCNPYYGWTCD